jgi:hypothetical protein
MGDMALSPEMKLLDELEGEAERYLLLEKWCFEGDRQLMLHSLLQLRREGMISVLRNTQAVPDWQLDEWRRFPSLAETTAALADVVIEATFDRPSSKC